MVSSILLMAGNSTRFGKEINKNRMLVGSKPIYKHSLDVLCVKTDEVIIVCNNRDIKEIEKEVELYHNVKVVLGGKTRTESVYYGILASSFDYVVIHDAARPNLTDNVIDIILEKKYDAFYVANKVVDTIRDIDGNTINRDSLLKVITPQGGKKELFILGYEKVLENKTNYTDDADLIFQNTNVIPKPIIINEKNEKITFESDLEYKDNLNNYLIGHSFDLHNLVENRPLILGGIKIDYCKGLLGHSDGDALLHAVAEAILGALSLGDLGHHFSDKDPTIKGIDSAVILSTVNQMMHNLNYQIVNIDTMIYAEKIKMKPYIDDMKKKIASILDIDSQNVSVKATTFEGNGLIGTDQAIGASAVVLLKKGESNYE